VHRSSSSVDRRQPTDGCQLDQAFPEHAEVGSARAGEIRVKEQPDRVKPRLAIVAVACGGLYRWRGDEIRARA